MPADAGHRDLGDRAVSGRERRALGGDQVTVAVGLAVAVYSKDPARLLARIASVSWP
jgi:hypothetical protein